jgi:membrane-bound inhibitor of C-type lysozyme
VTSLFLATAGCSHLASHESGITYVCNSGEQPVASYPSPETAFLEYRGEKHRLQHVRSGSGARYADDRIVWWIKGSEASLFVIEPDGSTGERLDQCRIADHQ